MLAMTKIGNSMKPSLKLILAASLAASLAATLSGCASTTLEQQIAVKEPGSWDFKYASNISGGYGYLRIYDNPSKIGWIVNEYGQKHPCSQGFTKAIKNTAPGWIGFTTDNNEKSFACDTRLRLIFRMNDQGVPYEGWAQKFTDRERKELPDFESTVKQWDAALLVKKSNATYTLVK
jgi:hypothetical protein